MVFPQHLYEEPVTIMPETLGTRFEVPVLLPHRTQDAYAIPELVQEYVERIEAPARRTCRYTDRGTWRPSSP
jgi:hypothetical protein